MAEEVEMAYYSKYSDLGTSILQNNLIASRHS